MADLNELKQAREKVRKLPLLYQAEVCVNITDNKNRTIETKTPQDYELAVLKEAISYYEKGTYNKDNLITLLKPDALWYNTIKNNGLLTLEQIKTKATKGSPQADKSYWQGARAVPEIFYSKDEEIADLTKERDQAKTAQTTAESNLKIKTDELKTAQEAQKKAEGESYTKEGTIKGLNNQIITLKSEKGKLETDLSDKEHTIKDQQKIIDDNKDLDTKLKELNKQLTDKDDELTKRNDKITALEIDKKKIGKELDDLGLEWEEDDFIANVNEVLSVKGLKAVKQLLKEQEAEAGKWQTNYNKAEEAIKELKEDSRVLEENKALLEQEKITLEKEKGKLEEVNKLLADDIRNLQQGGDKYLNKLLETYKEDISKITEQFYLNFLGLDESNDINPAYYNQNYFNLSKEEKEKMNEERSYLDLLTNLKGETDPEQVKDAFRIVALICATDKAQRISDKWINNKLAKKPQIKEPKLKTFNNIKKFWDLHTDLLPTEANNPLWLPIINEQSKYKNQINEIIKLWQAL